MPVALSNKMRQCVEFARFCENQKLDYLEAAELITLAHRAFKAGEASCNTGTEAASVREQKTAKQFTDKAKELGFGVDWPGLWPVLNKDGFDIYLPPVG